MATFQIYPKLSTYSSHSKSFFDSLLQQKWTQAVEAGVCRYILTDLKTKTIPGKYNFVAQLNVNRATNRRKPQEIVNICMPFNPNLFNFTKINEKEILFELNPTNWRKNDSLTSSNDSNVTHKVIINVSPLEYCNSLLVPFLNKSLPQVLVEDGLKVAIETVFLSSMPAFRIGFNGLGAHASVNHLHFHLYYLGSPLFIETANLNHLCKNLYLLKDYPVPAFVFLFKMENFDKLLKDSMVVIKYLQNKSIAHNLFITRGIGFEESFNEGFKEYSTVRLFIWPRKTFYGVKNEGILNLALCELAGHFPIKTESGFLEINEASACSIMQEVCLDNFEEVTSDIKNILNELD